LAEVKKNISLMRPLLPDYRYIEPYLKQIDKNRWYSNFGPLVREFETRLSNFFETEPDTVVTVSNGTAGITNTLRAMNLPKGNYCVVPSWTFIATPAAALASGLIPYFVDVDENSWALDPEKVMEDIKKIDGKVSAIIVVAPFGAPIDVKAWDKFTDDTGIKVIIDGAAAFDSVYSVPSARPSKTPIVISMHATKVFGIGEGGIVISTDKALIKRVQEMSNFGFSASRIVSIPGTNAKMSEYNAAVGLATLDLWPQTREVWICLKGYYANAFAGLVHRTNTSLWLSEDWVGSTFNIRLPTENADEVIAKLVESGIESRQWWIKGCHLHPAYEKYPKFSLPVTSAFGRSVIGLPFNKDINKEDVIYIVEKLREIIPSLQGEMAENQS